MKNFENNFEAFPTVATTARIELNKIEFDLCLVCLSVSLSLSHSLSLSLSLSLSHSHIHSSPPPRSFSLPPLALISSFSTR